MEALKKLVSRPTVIRTLALAALAQNLITVQMAEAAVFETVDANVPAQAPGFPDHATIVDVP